MKESPWKGLSPNVFRLGWVSLLNDIASEMLYPVIPIFLTSVLGAPVAALGFIEGAAEASASLLKSQVGLWSDRLGERRPFVFWGYTLSSVAKPLIALAQAWPLVMLSRVLDRSGKGLRAGPRDAMLADSVEPQFRGKAFGLHRGMDTAGAVLGPLLALVMIDHLQGNLRWVFMAAFIPAIAGALLVLTAEEKPSLPGHALQTAPPGPPASRSLPSIRWSALPGPFRDYLLAWGLFSAANSSDMFLLLKVKSAGSSTSQAILMYVFYNVVYAAASPWLGTLSDRIDRKRILAAGLAVFALVYAGFAAADAAWQYWILYGVYGLYIAATDGVGKACAVDLVPAGIRAAALGLLGTVTGLCALLASSVAGLLWTGFGPWACFGYGVLGAVAGALLMLRVKTVPQP